MKFNFMDPSIIMNVVIALIILGVGVFAFFVTLQNIPTVEPAQTSTQIQNSTYFAMLNASEIGNQVFNIVGVILIIGAIMAIVGIVYSYAGGFRRQ